jgi:pimeloyl-ACP methyl ester carboxylesterase
MLAGIVGITGCASSDDDDSGTPTPPIATCDNPTAPAATQHSLVINSPSDLDTTADPVDTTEIFYTVMTPERCPGDVFPVVLQSHGYGGTRESELAENGDLHPESAHFGSIDELTRALPYHGYVVISFDERGHGESTNANARIIDPAAETQDARALLDWAYDHADEYGIQRETGSGVAKDIKVGTLGYSYGGGFQMPLAALDARIDAIVPNGTWHGLMYSLLPGDSLKLSFGGLLCVLALSGGVANTPIVASLCNTIGPAGPTASTIRSRGDLIAAVAQPTTMPRPIGEEELISFFDTHSMAYFRHQQKAGQPWGFGESQAKLRKVPALFIQGNRDVLFNVTDAYWNYRYFSEAGGDVRLITTEGGHMNPFAGQVEGTADCGSVVGVSAALGWFDHHLKGIASAAYDALPEVCISIADTVDAPAAAAGLILDQFPVGSLSGSGAVPTVLASATVEVLPGTIAPVFVPVTTISGNDKVLAGAPTVGKLNVIRSELALPTDSTNAFVGIGIKRGDTTFLVDDEVTAFGEGEHTTNRNIEQDDRVLLPAIGERLQDGDEVGLLFYSQHIQYSAVVSAQSVSGLTGVINYLYGTPIPPVASSLEPALGLTYNNPYSVELTDVQLPILVPGSYSGSRFALP